MKPGTGGATDTSDIDGGNPNAVLQGTVPSGWRIRLDNGTLAPAGSAATGDVWGTRNRQSLG